MQAVLCGAQMILIDPHMHEPEESLAERLKMFRSSVVFEPCDQASAQVLQRIRWAKKEVARSIALGIKLPAIILVIDEFNAVMRNQDVAKEVADLLTEIGQ